MEPIIPPIWEALLVGTDVARDHFDRTGLELDLWLAAHITRSHARRVLEQLLLSPDIEIDDSAPTMTDLPNSGIRIRVANLEIWLLKAFHGGIPAPGPSFRRQQAWQSSMFELPAIVDVRATTRLFMIWDVDDQYDLVSLTLVRPKAGNAAPTSGEALWQIELPRPEEMIPLGTNGLQQVITLADLDTISIRKTETGTDAGANDLR